jgi:integrase
VWRHEARYDIEGADGRRCKDRATFDDLDDAVLWRARRIENAKLGEDGEKRERRKVLAGTTLRVLIHRYEASVLGKAVTPELAEALSSGFSPGKASSGKAFIATRKRSWKNELIGLVAFLRRAPRLCNKSLADITTEDFRVYSIDRLTEGVSPSTLRRELNPIRDMYKKARKWGYPLDDPFRDLELPKEPPSRDRVLKPEEELVLYKAIEEQCRDDKLRVRWLCLVSLALSTALRRGVLLNLKWEDINWEQKTITIKNTYWAGKKKAPPRAPLTMRASAFLKLYYDDLLPDNEREPTSRLFPMTESGFNSSWNRIISRTGLHDLEFRDLRRTATTRYAELKPVPLSVRENDYLLGHIRGLTQKAYEVPEFMGPIREKLDAADEALCESLLGSPADIAMGRAFSRRHGDGSELLPMPTPQQWVEWKKAERERQQRATR